MTVSNFVPASRYLSTAGTTKNFWAVLELLIDTATWFWKMLERCGQRLVSEWIRLHYYCCGSFYTFVHKIRCNLYRSLFRCQRLEKARRKLFRLTKTGLSARCSFEEILWSLSLGIRSERYVSLYKDLFWWVCKCLSMLMCVIFYIVNHPALAYFSLLCTGFSSNFVTCGWCGLSTSGMSAISLSLMKFLKEKTWQSVGAILLWYLKS